MGPLCLLGIQEIRGGKEEEPGRQRGSKENRQGRYQSYTPEIFSLKIRNANLETIAQHLFKIEEERMELFGGIEKCRIVAAKIIAAKP
jgi:hypothetical protein